MTARETLLTKFTNLRRRADERGRITLPARAVALGMETAISFLLAAILAGQPWERTAPPSAQPW